MRETLQRRIPLLSALLPMDDPNYGLDESWAALHPYWITLRPGESAPLALRLTNHSPRERSFRAAVRAPEPVRLSGVKSLDIAAHTKGQLEFTVQIPRDSDPGLRVVTADVGWEDGELREWTEAVVEVVP
jgi:hypothetical protein